MISMAVCTTRKHPSSGAIDPDLTLGALYEIVYSDVASMGECELMVVRRNGTRGPDLTRPKAMFKIFSVSGSTVILEVDRGDLFEMIRMHSDMLDYLHLHNTSPERASALSVALTQKIYYSMNTLTKAIKGKS